MLVREWRVQTVTIEEMRARKKELGYTNEMVAEKSGVSLGTVQKIFGGATSSPRYETIRKLEAALWPAGENYRPETGSVSGPDRLRESMFRYTAGTSALKTEPAHDGKWPRQGEYTLDDYYALPDDVRVELIDGVIYDMTAPTRKHQTIALHLWRQLDECIEEHCAPCIAYAAPVDVRLDSNDKTMVQPDIVVLCHEDDNDMRIEGAPEFVAEILSPSTRSKDCVIKLNKYMTAGVLEYWIIDPDEEKVFVYDFEEGCILKQYDFADRIPVAISNGKCEIDFALIKTAAGRRP